MISLAVGYVSLCVESVNYNGGEHRCCVGGGGGGGVWRYLRL